MKFETYKTLADGRCAYSCEFGSWIFGYKGIKPAKALAGAKNAVSTMRYQAYWAKVPANDIRREQD